MSTTALLLIRHASHDRLGRVLCGRMAGVTLSERGRREAETLARALRALGPVDAVYASPLERAVETARPIADVLRLGITVEDDLNELDFGAWSGLGFDALRADPRWAAWNTRRDQSRPPGGETMPEGQVRVTRCLERLRGRHPDATVAVVSHSDVIKAALAWGLGLPLAFYARFEISPASVSRIMLGETDVTVWGVNQTFAA